MSLPHATDVSAIFQAAITQHRQGRLPQAQALCEQVLAADPRHASAWHLRGLIALAGSDPAQGVEWIERSLELNAQQPAAHANIGNFLLGSGQPELALAHFDRALDLKADYPLALYNRGNALSALGRFAEALASYDAAARLQDHWMTQNNRGLALLELGRPAQAAAAFEAALRSDARALEARMNLGRTYLQLDRADDAVQCFEQACRLAQASRRADREPDCWCGLGNAWMDLKRPADAWDAYSRALQLRAGHLDALCGRCAAALALKRPAEALEDAQFALGLGSPSATLLNNLGNALAQLGRTAEALSRYDQAIKLDPSSADAIFNRSSVLRALARHAEAARCCEQVLRIAPRHRHAFGQLFQLRMDCCDWRDHEALLDRLRQSIAADDAVVNPMTLLLLDSPQLQLIGAQRFAADQWLSRDAAPLAPPHPSLAQPSQLPRTSPRREQRRIRLAYLSADFREHPVSQLLVGVLERHDRGRFEALGVSFAPPEDSAFGRRVRNAFDRVFDVELRSDAEVAALLREQRIDIAVDLMGFTQGQRFGIFARRAAPIQVGWLGFAGTTGTPHLDYVIADRIALPQGQERFFTERVVRLPHCFLPHDDRQPIAAVPARAPQGLADDAMVFCAFANSCKINPRIFAVWMQILRKIPQGILWLRASGADTQANLLEEARRRGVDPTRLVFAPRVDDHAQHLARLSCADLFLDTTPYNAHSTGCDALWAGVPMVTCAGESFASRVAASALHAAGLPELAAGTLDHYEELVLELARAPEALRALRARLHAARLESPLFQTAQFTAHLEEIFRHMHERARYAPAGESFALD